MAGFGGKGAALQWFRKNFGSLRVFSLTDPARESTCRGPHRGSNSVVECNLAKVDVEGSNPFSRSEKPKRYEPVRGDALAGFFV